MGKNILKISTTILLALVVILAIYSFYDSYRL